jgi:hypothetical protein
MFAPAFIASADDIELIVSRFAALLAECRPAFAAAAQS